MSQRHSRDPQLERRWRDLTTRQQRSGLTIRQFCRQHAVSESSFHFWRAELARRDSTVTKPSVQPAAVFVPVHVTATLPIEVVLPSRLVVRVPPGSDPMTVARLIAALEAKPC